MSLEDQSRLGEGGSEKTIAAVNTILAPTAAVIAVPQITDNTSEVDAALALASAGIYVFPVDHPELSICAGVGKYHDPFDSPDHQRGKHPCVAFSEKATIKEQVIRAYWSQGPRNIGINCGKSNLVVIDEDKLGAFKRYADEHGVKIPRTLVVATAKGRHYYFLARADHPLGNKEGAFQNYNINIRGGNGYVVGPRSVHATGVVYRIEVPEPPVPIPDWVIAGITEKAASPNGKVETYGAGALAPRGLEAVPDVIRGPRDDSGGQRHQALVSYASRLRSLSLTRTEAEPLYRLVWERCEQPPVCRTPLDWDEALGKLDDVYDRYPEGRSEEYRQEAGDERATFDSLVAKEAVKIRVREAARELVDASNRPPVAPFDAGTLGEILTRPPQPKARIADLVPWEAGTLITAQRKVGKTTFVGNLCRSLINGESFLGCFEVRPIDGDIAMLNFEMPALQLAQWLDSMRIPQNRLYLINLRARANPLASEQDRAALAQLLRSRGSETIIYDPFGRAYTGKSQNDPGEVGAWLAELDRFTRGECGAKDLFLTAHAGWDGERTRGASALEDWADSIITLTRDSSEDGNGSRYIRAIGRDVDLEEDQLRFTREERHLELARTGSRKATAEKRKVDTLRAAILKIVSKQPKINGTEVERELRDAGVTFQRGDHRPVLKALVEEGKLTVEPGKRGAKCYEIAQLAQIAQASPEVAQGLAGGASPARPIEDGLATTNSGTPDTQPEAGLADGVDHANTGHTLFSDEPPAAAQKKGRLRHGTCAGCGDRMTITEEGQTTHPGCEVAQ